MQASIVRWGNSQGVRLPKLLLDSVNLAENDKVEIIAENDSLIIKKFSDRKNFKTIQERFKDFDGEYEPINIDWGKPVGEEIW